MITKKDYKKKACEKYLSLSRFKDTKISQKMKPKSLLRKKNKNGKNEKKRLIIIIRKYFHLQILVFFQGRVK